MAQNGGKTPNQDKYKQNKPQVFEYEDFGSPAMYFWAILTVLLMLGIVILFGMIVASGAVAVSEAING